jgi:hypothetical protein
MLFVFDYLLLSTKFPGLKCQNIDATFSAGNQRGTDRFSPKTGFLLLLLFTKINVVYLNNQLGARIWPISSKHETAFVSRVRRWFLNAGRYPHDE